MVYGNGCDPFDELHLISYAITYSQDPNRDDRQNAYEAVIEAADRFRRRHYRPTTQEGEHA